jgi:hypothetical protein
VCPRYLARERLVEVAPVVQAGERVHVGELPRLAEPPCVLDRGACPAGQLLELGEHLVVEVDARARVDGEEAELLAVRLERHGEPRAETALALVDVGDPHRPRPRAVRRHRQLRVLGVEAFDAEPGHDRLAARATHRDDRRVDAARGRRGLERPGQYLVEVDRAGEVAERPAAHPLGPRPGERGREIACQALDPLVDVGERRRQLGVDRAFAAAQPQPGEQDEGDADGAKCKVGDHGRIRFR